MNKQQILDLLKADVVPALGCTEPVCVALCAATAAAVLAGDLLRAEVQVNPGIYKNGMSAGIPNCSAVGLNHAAAIGACLKNPEKTLQLLEDLTPEKLAQATRLVKEGAVHVGIAGEEKSLYVRCELHTAQETAVCIIRDAHTNVVHLEKNGQVLHRAGSARSGSGGSDVVAQLQEMKISRIRELVDSCTEEELAFLMDGVKMNETLAAYSESTPTGVGIADSLRKTMGSSPFAADLLNSILLKVSSAAESRLDGCPLPTMSSSGAGTKGLVVILPISETAKALGSSRLATLRALALGHLLNRYINAHIGKLAPMCSCVMSSSTAASAAMAYLMGGNDQQIGWAIRNMSGTVTGMICDGGKVGCALKVASGSASAYLCAVTAVNNAALRVTDGICAETPEDCIRNMALLGKHGMVQMDNEILKIMESKKHS